MNRPRSRSKKNRGFNFREFAAVLRPELLPLLADRERDDLRPLERKPSLSETAALLSKDSSE